MHFCHLNISTKSPNMISISFQLWKTKFSPLFIVANRRKHYPVLGIVLKSLEWSQPCVRRPLPVWAFQEWRDCLCCSLLLFSFTPSQLRSGFYQRTCPWPAASYAGLFSTQHWHSLCFVNHQSIIGQSGLTMLPVGQCLRPILFQGWLAPFHLHG